MKEGTVAAALQQISGQVNRAAANGGFDAREAPLTRSPVTVDRKGWLALAHEVEAMTSRIRRIEIESAKRLQDASADGPLEASVVMMLFTSPAAMPGDAAPVALPPVPAEDGAAPARGRRRAQESGRAQAGAG